MHPVAQQAQFDLDCPRPQIRYMKLGEGHWGAIGCGKRARYRRVCVQRLERRKWGYSASVGSGYRLEDACRWELDSPVFTQTEPSSEEKATMPSSGI